MSRSPLNVWLFAGGAGGTLALRGLAEAGHRVGACFVAQPEPDSASSSETPSLISRWLPALRDACASLGVPCSQTAAEVSLDLSARPDVVLSVGYPRRIGMPYLALGRIGAFNVAFSQLPRYRGCFPWRWAILNDEAAWGVTVHQMTPRYCDGAVLHRRPVPTRPDENACDFYLRCCDAAARAAVEAVNKLAGGVYALLSVDPKGVQFFGPEVPFGGRIDWSQSGARIASFVRALDFGRAAPEQTYEHLAPPAAATILGQDIGIWRAGFGGTMSVYPPGTITRCDDEVWVQAGRGHVVIDKVHARGRDWDAPDYFAARGLMAGDLFDTSHQWAAPGAGEAAARELSHAA